MVSGNGRLWRRESRTRMNLEGEWILQMEGGRACCCCWEQQKQEQRWGCETRSNLLYIFTSYRYLTLRSGARTFPLCHRFSVWFDPWMAVCLWQRRQPTTDGGSLTKTGKLFHEKERSSVDWDLLQTIGELLWRYLFIARVQFIGA